MVLRVGGVVPLSTVDYPDYISSVVFLQGCGWSCKYCHNRSLQEIYNESLSKAVSLSTFSWSNVIELLKLRKGFVDAVVFSGGEPLLQESLPEAMEEVKNMGFLVGLHTAGAIPTMLEKVIHLTNWVGFDVKNKFEEYDLITGVPNSGKSALDSLKLLIEAKKAASQSSKLAPHIFDFEVRITMYESLDTLKISALLKNLSSMGVKTAALQKCRNAEEIVVEHPIFSDKILLNDISKRFDNFFIR